MHINSRILTLMRADPTRDRWTLNQLAEHLGVTPEEAKKAAQSMNKSGRIKSDGRGYALSAQYEKIKSETDPLDPRVIRPKAAPAAPAGPCPQSDALLRLMRSTGGDKSLRAWGALWMERDTTTHEALQKLVKRDLVTQRGDLYRAKATR